MFTNIVGYQFCPLHIGTPPNLGQVSWWEEDTAASGSPTEALPEVITECRDRSTEKGSPQPGHVLSQGPVTYAQSEGRDLIYMHIAMSRA